MKLHLFLAFILDSHRKPQAGPILATDSVHAMSRAIQKCKAAYGPRSKVSKIVHLAEADMPFMQRTEMLQVLSEFDQVAFAAVELEKLTRQSLKLIQDLQSYVQSLQARLEN
jgi:hypothetical protein